MSVTATTENIGDPRYASLSPWLLVTGDSCDNSPSLPDTVDEREDSEDENRDGEQADAVRGVEHESPDEDRDDGSEQTQAEESTGRWSVHGLLSQLRRIIDESGLRTWFGAAVVTDSSGVLVVLCARLRR